MPKADSTAAAFETFFAGVGAKDKLSIEKHLAVIDAEADPGHGRAWRRLAVTLRRHAPLAVQTVGQQVVQFFVPDGKYRMQAFTLEDKRDGVLLVYLPNVVDQAVKEKVLGKPAGKAGKVAGKGSSFFDDEDDAAQPVEYPVLARAGETLRVEAMDHSNTPDPPAHVRHMLGWNRRAVRVTIPTMGADAKVEAVEAMCEIAARSWADKTDKADKPEKAEKAEPAAKAEKGERKKAEKEPAPAGSGGGSRAKARKG